MPHLNCCVLSTVTLCFLRWLPLSHDPDPRYVGDSLNSTGKFGVYAADEPDDVIKAQTGTTMQQLKRHWGFEH